jgi:hypothetical protein
MRYNSLESLFGVSASCVALLALVFVLGTAIASGTAAGQPDTSPQRLAAAGHAAAWGDSLALCNAPEVLELVGPQAGIASIGYAFTSTITPPTATLPIAYTWKATQQLDKLHPLGGLSDTVTFSWGVSGTKLITVTADNILCGPPVTATQRITIEASPPCQSPESVQIQGPLTGSVDTAYTFSATITPSTAMPPITYTWEATDHVSASHIVDSLSDTLTLSWDVTGTKLLTVTSANLCDSPVSHTHSITIETVPGCNALQAVELLGPLTGTLGIANEFTATVQPLTASEPVTYTWEATGQAASSELSGLSHTVALTWAVTGTQVVTVTADNTCGPAVGMTDTISIIPRQVYVYLPVIQRQYIHDPCEPNDSFADACGPLGSGWPYHAYILEDTGQDYYYIEVSSKKPIDVQLAVPAAWDLDLYLYDSSETLVARSAEYKCGTDESIQYHPLTTGRFYIRVYPFKHCTGIEPYSLLATFD